MTRIKVVIACAAMAGFLAGSVYVLGQSATTAPAAAKSPITAEKPPAAPCPDMIFDGHVCRLEYADAKHFTFANGHGDVDVYAKVRGPWLCFAFVIPDETVHPGDDMVVMLGTKNDRQAAPGKDDIRGYVRRKIENSRMERGDGKAWADEYGAWEYRATSYAAGWEMECRIPLASIGVTDKTTLGFALRIWDDKPQKMYNWPAGSKEDKPNTWGTITLDAAKVIDIAEKP